MRNHFKYGLNQIIKTAHQSPATSYAQSAQLIGFASQVSVAGNQRTGENIWRNRIINALPAAEIEILSVYGRRINLTPGQSIYRYGDTVDYFYFPETAIISQYQVLEDGRTCEISMIGNEGVVGLTAGNSVTEAICWSEAMLAGSALQVSGEVFRRNLGNNSQLHKKLQEFTNSYVEQLSQRIICNYFHQIKERFCSWLLMVAERCRQPQFSFTQEAMARLLGVHRPSLTCIAKDLQQDNLIAYTRGKIKIVDKQKLAAQACSCYSNYHQSPVADYIQ